MKRFYMGLFLIFLALPVFAQTPRYKNYMAPFPQIGGDGAEPSIGVNWATSNVMYQAGLETIRIRFTDTTSPAQTTWTEKQSLITSLFSLDPILFTDRRTNRTFVSQLDAGCSLTEYTNDDGDHWSLSVGCGVPAGIDHQSIGGGPYAALPVIPHSSYPNSVFYCSQNLVSAICSRSDNGGFTFGLGLPIYLLTQCDGRHGRIKVGPDGTIYVPNSSCGTQQGVAVSENNGLTWTVRKIPGSAAGGSDPSIGIGSNNTVYFGYQNGDGKPRVATSRDRGRTWVDHQYVGQSKGINNIVFPAVVAGDDNRAAFAFLGTTAAGNSGLSSFPGIWHLYVASTFDGGKTWTTVDTTPTDPVQVGSIDIRDGLQPSGRRITPNMSTPLLDRKDRNLLDFIDATVDKQGRVLVAYADGCVGDCVQNPTSSLSRSAIASVMRQSGGKRLFAANDPIEPSKPAAPLLSGSRSSSGISLSWSQPDHGGSAITKYKIYRRTSTSSYALYKSLGIVNTYKDTAVTTGIKYFYKVSAINTKGEGAKGNEISL